MHGSILKDQVRFTNAASSSTRTLKDWGILIFQKEAIKTMTIKDKGSFIKATIHLDVYGESKCQGAHTSSYRIGFENQTFLLYPSRKIGKYDV
jgi:hypothetical protein